MIEVKIAQDGEVIATIKIEQIDENFLGEADYTVKFKVDRRGALGMHRRMVWRFPRLRYNVLGLLRQALMTLEEKELELEHGGQADSPDLARRQLPPGGEVQGGQD